MFLSRYLLRLEWKQVSMNKVIDAMVKKYQNEGHRKVVTCAQADTRLQEQRLEIIFIQFISKA